MRLITLILLAAGAAIAQDAHETVRRAVEIDERNTEISRHYIYLQRQDTRQMDSAGNDRKPREIKTFEISMMEGSPYRKLVARNDQPISQEEQNYEAAKMAATLEERKKETREQRERRIAEWKRKDGRQREPLKELPDAFDFKIAGEEAVNGAAAWVIDATPKKGYRPRQSSASFFPKVKARLWIDKKDGQWARLDMESMDTITFGGILLRLAKGSHLVMEQMRVANALWLPKRVHVEASARILLVKGFRADMLWDFSEYRKSEAGATSAGSR